MHLYFPGVDPPFLDETLNSLFQRIGQRHDIGFSQLHRIFETTKDSDIDFCMTAEQLDAFGQRCRLSTGSLSLIKNSLCRFVEKPHLKELLLFKKRDEFDYRFCTYCWRNDHAPYLRLDWRFRSVSHCRVHGQPLEERCMSCAMPLTTHRSILGGTFTPPPVPNLAICFHCRYDMRQAARRISYLAPQPSLRQLNFQNAIISAILNGHFQTEADGVRRSVDDLPAYIREIGMKKESTSVQIFGELSTNEARALGSILGKAVKDSLWFDRKRGRTSSMPSGLHLKQFLVEKDILLRKCRVK